MRKVELQPRLREKLYMTVWEYRKMKKIVDCLVYINFNCTEGILGVCKASGTLCSETCEKFGQCEWCANLESEICARCFRVRDRLE